MIRVATDADFGEQVERSSKPSLVDFWAPWCTPCKALDPVLQRVAAQNDALFDVVKVNADENPQTVAKLGIMSLPTLVLYNGGNPNVIGSGVMSEASLLTLVKGHLTGIR